LTCNYCKLSDFGGQNDFGQQRQDSLSNTVEVRKERGWPDVNEAQKQSLLFAIFLFAI